MSENWYCKKKDKEKITQPTNKKRGEIENAYCESAVIVWKKI